MIRLIAAAAIALTAAIAPPPTPTGTVLTADPWLPLIMCESAGNPTLPPDGTEPGAGLFQITRETQLDAARAANRPDLADPWPHHLTPGQQRELAEIIRTRFGIRRWTCHRAYAACFDQTGGPVWCYQPDLGHAAPVPEFAG